jgi:glycosyltransferase involved in cell wall biosynthesis
MEPCAVLHITSLHGGGVDRHVRDIARGSGRGQLVWHAGDAAEVLEVPGEPRYLALDPAAVDRDGTLLADFLRHARVGVVHAHSVAAAARRRARAAAQSLGVRTVATLHDVLFLRREGFEPGALSDPDPAWLAETSAFLRDAAAVVAPSAYIAGLARKHVPGLEVTVIPNGTSPPPAWPDAGARPGFAARGSRRVAAVIGAIGPHKGSAVLDEVDKLLRGTDIAIVVVGYLDTQVEPGWRGEHLFVHGAYREADVGGLLAAYGARLALFPNRVPESFSYALSEAWDAGLPALVPDAGALAERVREHGGGWILPPGAGAHEIAAALEHHLRDDGARVESGQHRVPRLEDMTRSLDALYARFGLDAAAPVDARSPRVQELLAKNLDGTVFREELARLADELAQVRAGLEAERGQARRFETEAREWIAKLEGDIAKLQAELAAEVEARRGFAEENAALRINKEALDRLPSLLGRLLLKRARDARG